MSADLLAQAFARIDDLKMQLALSAERVEELESQLWEAREGWRFEELKNQRAASTSSVSQLTMCNTEKKPAQDVGGNVDSNGRCLGCEHVTEGHKKDCAYQSTTVEQERESDRKTEAELRDFYDWWGREDGNSPGFNRDKAKLYGRIARHYKLALEDMARLGPINCPNCRAYDIKAKAALAKDEFPPELSRPACDPTFWDAFNWLQERDGVLASRMRAALEAKK